jgi:hypothetical protein
VCPLFRGKSIDSNELKKIERMFLWKLQPLRTKMGRSEPAYKDKLDITCTPREVIGNIDDKIIGGKIAEEFIIS